MQATFLVSTIGFLLLFLDLKRMKAILVLIYICFLIFLTSTASISPFISWMLIGFIWVILRRFFEKNKNSATFSPKEQRNLIDELILTMKSGSSLRWSLEEILSHRSEKEKKLLEMLSQDNLLLNDDKKTTTLSFEDEKQVEIFIQRLKKIDLLKHRKLENMENWRCELKLTEEFRQKSRQASQQANIQTTFCSLVFLIGVVINIHFANDGVYKRIFFAAVPFFTALILIKLIKESYKWKV